MPELPDVLLYQTAIQKQFVGRELVKLSIKSPFVLRTFEVEPTAYQGKRLTAVSRLGKRLVLHFDANLFAVVHLMIAGRFHWKKAGTQPKSKVDLAALNYENATLMLTEASSKKRAGLWLFDNPRDVQALHQPGLDVLTASLEEFQSVLCRSNNTLKRALTDPQRFDGIGNAYSDEILHAARLSPLTWTTRLTAEDIERLWQASRDTLSKWIARQQEEWLTSGKPFPEHVTAFRPDMAVHGKYGEPCPICAAPVQRIRYAENECNYCARCQTGGRLLADRSLSRLLKDDWPKSIDDLE